MMNLPPYPYASNTVNSGDGGGYGGGHYEKYGWRSDPYKLRRDALVRALQRTNDPVSTAPPPIQDQTARLTPI